MKYEAAIICDLEWGDSEEEVIVNEEENESNVDADVEENTEVNEDDGVVETDSQLATRNRVVKTDSQLAIRNRKPPVWMRNYETREGFSEEENEVQLVIVAIVDPIYFEKAVKSEKWRTTMDVEMEAIKKNGTWELIELPKRGKTIGVKWVYKTKLNENEKIEKHKARLVAKGYTQQYGVIFAPLARMETIRFDDCTCSSKKVVHLSIGCEICILTW